jgi:hypothetical protein
MTKFQIGKTYITRLACDLDCILQFTIVKRTDKFITFTDWQGKQSRAGVFQIDQVEHCFPTGRYSMAPVISAN